MKNFNQIYSDNHKMVLIYISMKINDSLVAEELTNDVFMRVHKHLDNYDAEKSSMKTWVMNIANNIVIDHYRKAKIKHVSMDISPEDEESGYASWKTLNVSTELTPLRNMINEEVGDRIRDEINSLDETYRNVANLYFIEQLSYDEIGVRLNIPLGTVKGQINRARKKLTTKLESVRI